MKRVAFAILAGISLVLSIAAAVAWPLSYWKPRTLNVATRNGDPAVGESPAEVTAKAFIENRSGRIVWLSQWVHLEERKRGAWVISADCSLPRMLLVFADDGTGLPAFANMRIADTVVEPAYTSAGTQQPDTVWRRAGFGLDWRQPIPESAEARDRAASMPARSGGLNTGVPRNLGVLPMDYAGYRQLMIPSWLPVLLGLPLPLLWLRTNRRSVRWAREGRCPGCGYDLRATPERCPECGRARANQKSKSMARAMSRCTHRCCLGRWPTAPQTREPNMQTFTRPFRLPLPALAAVCLLATALHAHTGSGIAVDRDGQVFFLDTGSGLWKIDAQEKPTHLSPLLFHWLALDAGDRFARARFPSGARGDISKVGAKPTLLLSSDYPIAIAQDGNLYYPAESGGALKIMRMSPSGETSVLATLPPAASGPLQHINGIAAGPEGSIYYTENSVIRRISAEGEVSTAATVTALPRGPSIPGTDQHPYLRGLAVDAGGVMYVADNGDARVLKITPEGKITTLLELESPWSPTAVALHGDVLYVLEFSHMASDVRQEWMPRVRKIAADGTTSILLTVDQMPGARPAGGANTRGGA